MKKRINYTITYEEESPNDTYLNTSNKDMFNINDVLPQDYSDNIPHVECSCPPLSNDIGSYKLSPEPLSLNRDTDGAKVGDALFSTIEKQELVEKFSLIGVNNCAYIYYIFLIIMASVVIYIILSK